MIGDAKVDLFVGISTAATLKMRRQTVVITKGFIVKQ